MKILVIGASGFVGRRLAQVALAEGHVVRGLARDPAKVTDLAAAGCEIVRGDVSDAASIDRAVAGVDAVVIAVHTLSAQPGAAGQRFMAVETAGVRNVMVAAAAHGVRRIVYLTSVGITRDARSEWLRERWRTEQLLLDADLDATVIHPGMIVGIGGMGFGAVLANARRRVAILVGDGRRTSPTIALDDLVHTLLDVLPEPRAFGHSYDVGNDDVLTNRQMIDIAADVLGRRPPRKLGLPIGLLGLAAPPIERLSQMPKGAIRGLLDGIDFDPVIDLAPIRAVLPRRLLSYRDAVRAAVSGK